MNIKNIYKSENFKANNCLVCAFRPLINITFFILSVEGHCKHSRSRFSTKPYFTISPIFNILTYFLNFSMGVLYLYYYYVVVGLSQTKRDFLFSVIDLIYIELTFILIGTMKVNLPAALRCLNEWSQMIEYRIYYGIPTFLTSQQCRGFNTYGKMMHLSYFFQLSFF